MAAIDLLFRTNLESERLHQLVLVPLLRHTNLPDLLLPGFGAALTVEWEPRGGTYDLSMTNTAGRTVMIELKVDAGLPEHQIDNQIHSLQPSEDLVYLLLGHSRLTARPRLDRRLAAQDPPVRSSVHDLQGIRDALARVEVTTDSTEAADARDLATAYRHHLAALQRRTAGFFDHPPSEWNGARWGYYYGYFDHCRRTLGCMHGAAISYVPTPTGGFRACHWQWTDVEPDVQAYLQFQDDVLCFKIYVEDGIDRGQARDRIRERLLVISEALDLPIRRPDRLGHGQTMTLAYLDAAQTGFGLRSEQDRFARTLETAVAAIGRLVQRPA